MRKKLKTTARDAGGENMEKCVCPNCGAIRVNWGPAVEKDEYIEHHGFCRQCETEFVVKEEKK